MFSSRGSSPIVSSKGLSPATKRAVQVSLGRRSPVNPVTDTNYHAVSVRRGDLPVGQAPIPVVPPGQSVPRLNQGYNYPVKMASDFVKQGYQSFRHPIRRLTSPNQQMMFPGMGGKIGDFGGTGRSYHLRFKDTPGDGTINARHELGIHQSEAEAAKAAAKATRELVQKHGINHTYLYTENGGSAIGSLHKTTYGIEHRHLATSPSKRYASNFTDFELGKRLFHGKGAEQTGQKIVSEHLAKSDYGESGLPVGPNSLRPSPAGSKDTLRNLIISARINGGELMGISPSVEGLGGGYHALPGGYKNQGPSWTGMWQDHGMSRNPGKNVHLPTPQPKEFPPTGPDGFYDHEVGPYPDSPLASRKAPREIDDMPDNARNIIHEGGGKPSYESSSPHANDFNNALNELTNGTNADLRARIARNKAFIAKQRLMSSGKSEFNPLEPHAPKNTTMPNNPVSRPYEPAKTPSSYMRKMVDAQLGTKPVNDLYDLWDMEAQSGGNYKPAPTGEPRGGHKNPLFGEPEYDKGFAQAYDQRGSRQKIFRDVNKNKQLSRVMFNYLLKSRN